MELIRVLRDTYVDSVMLMRLSREVALDPVVQEMTAVAATPPNLEYLHEHDFAVAQDVGPNDLVIAVRAESEAAVAAAMERIDWLLAHWGDAANGQADRTRRRSRSITTANRDGRASLALVAVPDRYATYEAARALDAGLHVFCFSSGMDLETEARLKRWAASRDLLFMGPDCGTAIVDGLALGFANAVRPGPVGIVGASGTGIQEVSCLLDGAGVGISHAIGVGGRDLSSTVGGVMTRHALQVLARNEATKLILVISKPPDAEVAAGVAEAVRETGKPAGLAFLGRVETGSKGDEVHIVPSLEAAAALAANHFGASLPTSERLTPPARTPGWIRGVFSGGTLCAEAMAVVSDAVGSVRSNVPLRQEWSLEDPWRSQEHTFVDLGSDELTEGRAHPMIDPSLRNERLLHEAIDPDVGVVVFDVVLGFGAHPDPASELAPVIEGALRERPGRVTLVAALCGARGDPQDPRSQAERLRSAGAVVAGSTAGAARLALAAAGVPG